MSFNINFYVNNSENERITKDLTSVTSMTGNLRDECSVTDPVIVIEGDLSSLVGVNYMYIPTFNRYYYINDMRSIRKNFIEINAHVDVLMSFAEGILDNTAIVKKQENAWNLYLNDGSLKCYQNPLILTKAFPSGFTTQEFVLAVAGSAQNNS